MMNSFEACKYICKHLLPQPHPHYTLLTTPSGHITSPPSPNVTTFSFLPLQAPYLTITNLTITWHIPPVKLLRGRATNVTIGIYYDGGLNNSINNNNNYNYKNNNINKNYNYNTNNANNNNLVESFHTDHPYNITSFTPSKLHPLSNYTLFLTTHLYFNLSVTSSPTILITPKDGFINFFFCFSFVFFCGIVLYKISSLKSKKKNDKIKIR